MKRAYTDEHARAGVHAPLPEIETWPNQYPDYEIEIVQPEFTSVCHKMYLNAYRDLGIFQENIVNRVLQDVVKATKPKFATAIGEFAARGGLSTTVTATWSAKRGKR